jgi:hypothetical protein
VLIFSNSRSCISNKQTKHTKGCQPSSSAGFFFFLVETIRQTKDGEKQTSLKKNVALFA